MIIVARPKHGKGNSGLLIGHQINNVVNNSRRLTDSGGNYSQLSVHSGGC